MKQTFQLRPYITLLESTTTENTHSIEKFLAGSIQTKLYCKQSTTMEKRIQNLTDHEVFLL